MRATLTSGVASNSPSSELYLIAEVAAREAATCGDLAARSAKAATVPVTHFAADPAARSSAYSAPTSATDTAVAAYFAVRSASDAASRSAIAFAQAAIYSAASADASSLSAEESPALVFSYRLWREDEMPEGLQANLDALRVFWQAAPATWGFWERWYDGMFQGKPLDWDLQREVALIPDEDWQKGPERIARLIAEIEARFTLKARIRELEEELSRASKDRFGIGGNNPPEAIADAPWISKEFTIIWAPLQDLKSEVERGDPEPSRIARLLALLGDALGRGLRWCASKADLIVNTTIRWAIPWTGGYLALNPDKLTAVIEAGKRWLSTLP